MTKRKIEYWVIPPEADAEFVANMENVLETYARPYDPARPVICMDEQPVQLVKETRQPIPGTKEHAKRVDYEYERNGTDSILMFCGPLAPGARRPPAHNAPSRTGLRRWPRSWTAGTRTANGSPWCATTSTRTLPGLSTRSFPRTGPAATSAAPYKGKGTGETNLFRRMYGTLKPGDVVLADALFDDNFKSRRKPGRGKKSTPAITVPQIRVLLASSLHRKLNCDHPEIFARQVTRRLYETRSPNSTTGKNVNAWRQSASINGDNQIRSS